MVTGRPAMILNSEAKSSRCIGRILASAFLRPSTLSDRIISRTAVMRSASKNICPLLHRPIPSLPSPSAVSASPEASALVCPLPLLTLSSQPFPPPHTTATHYQRLGTWHILTSPVTHDILNQNPSPI